MKKLIFLLSLLIIFASCSTQISENTQISSTLTQEEIYSLNLALEDEYKAEATYQKIIDDFGEVRPFSNIIKAEQTHSSKLIQLFNKYELDVPQNTFLGNVGGFNSVEEACEIGVQAEIENIELYDILLSSTDREDITKVFLSLQRASQYSHLPAFQRCD